MPDIPKLVYIGVICIALVVAMSALLPVVFEVWFGMDTTGFTWSGEPDKGSLLPMALMPFFGVILIGAVIVVAIKSAL